jgi:hypothetical protein
MKTIHFLTILLLGTILFPTFSFAIECPSGTVPNKTSTACEDLKKLETGTPQVIVPQQPNTTPTTLTNPNKKEKEEECK